MTTTSESPHDLDSLAGFERLYRAYYGYAWVVLARLGVPPAQIDDAHQELFVTVHRRRETFQRGRPVKPWLVGIARRVAFRYRRSQRRSDRKQSALLHASGREPTRTGTIDARVEAGQFLQVFLDGLEPDQREVFVLGELEGYSGPEIAERLGINLNTAYTRLRTVRGQLRRALDGVEERRVSEARLERGLVLVLPQLSKPGWLAWSWATLAKGKLGVAAGVAGAGVVGAIVLGVGARDVSSEGGGHVEVTASRKDIDGAKAGAAAPTVAEQPAPPVVSEGMPVPSLVPVEGAARPERPAVVAPEEVGRRKVAPAPAASAGQAEATADLQREVESLTRAREALAAGRAGDALALLDAHARDFPASTLGEARTTLRIACLCAAGRKAQARGEAAAWLRGHPSSTLARHAASRCEDEVAEAP